VASRRCVAMLLCLSVLLVPACGPAGLTGPESDPVTLHLKWLHQAQFAGFYMAKHAGFASDERLELTIIPGGVDAPPIPAVLEGKAQFGVAGGGDLIQARAEGSPVVALAVILQKSPVCFITKSESGIRRPHDFVGHRVGVKTGTGTDIPYLVMLANVGVDRNDLEEIPVSADLMPFYIGEVDVYPGYVINEPDTIRRAGYDINVILASDYGVNMYADVLFTTEAMIRDRPDLVGRFVRAMMRGWNYAIENREETVKVVMEYAPDSDKAHQEAMLATTARLVRPGYIKIGSMDRRTWKDMHDTLLRYGVIESAIDVNALYTEQFLLEETP